MGLQFKSKSDKIKHRASILSMKVDEGMSSRDIARNLGITHARVSQLLQQAYTFVNQGYITLPEGWEIRYIEGRGRCLLHNGKIR